MFTVLAQRQAQLHACGVLSCVDVRFRYEWTCTVAILAQGTHWAPAETQAYFGVLDSQSLHTHAPRPAGTFMPPR